VVSVRELSPKYLPLQRGRKALKNAEEFVARSEDRLCWGSLQAYHTRPSSGIRMSFLRSAFEKTRDFLTPTLKSSQLGEGQLTPEEFVAAGDALIRVVPAWQWSRGQTSRTKPYLPPDKQFLITRGVACHSRVRSLAASSSGADKEVEGGSWIEPATAAGVGSTKPAAGKAAKPDEEEDLEVISSAGGEAPGKQAPKAPSGGDEEDDEYGDLSSFMDKTLMVVKDPASAASAATSSLSSASSAAKASKTEAEDFSCAAGPGHGPVPQSTPGAAGASSSGPLRLYDVHITYDNFYRTPRVYLKGHTSEGVPLSPDQMLEDVYQDYSNKTATIESHPNLGGGEGADDASGFISIHPCRHSQAMRKIFEAVLESSEVVEKGASSSGGSAGPSSAAVVGPSAEAYLFYFLKMMGSIIPTVEYDQTMPMSVHGSASAGSGTS
jgi:ubiquitin-like-conjugating enzyme ATG3